jgi:toxin YoeB
VGRLIFAAHAWQDYQWWLRENRQIVKRINRLIQETQRNPTEGIGKPEPLKHALQGAWSRRISDEHRMVYLVRGEDLEIVSLRYHY